MPASGSSRCWPRRGDAAGAAPASPRALPPPWTSSIRSWPPCWPESAQGAPTAPASVPDGLQRDLQLHLVSEQVAAVQRLVPGDAEIPAVDHRGPVEGDPFLPVVVSPDPQVGPLEDHRPGGALDREQAAHFELLVLRHDAGALEGDLREAVCGEEPGGAEVGVAAVVIGVDAPAADDDVHRPLLPLLAPGDHRPRPLGELAPDPPQEVPDTEADLGVGRVDP